MALKPNIVGLGHFFKNLTGANTAPTWNVAAPGASSNHACNVLNATPSQDFGVDRIALLTAPNALRPFNLALCQQFTVTKPSNGNGVLVEVTGGVMLAAPRSALLVPCFGKLGSAASTQMEAKAVVGVLRPIGEPDRPTVDPGSDTLSVRCVTWKEQIFLQDDDPSGVYVHGFFLREEGGTTNIAIGKITGHMAHRSLDWARAGVAPYNPAI